MTDNRDECLLPRRRRASIKRKSPLFGLCYTELPHSRFAVLCFCYPFGDFSNLGKSLIRTDPPGVLLCPGYTECEAGIVVHPARFPFGMMTGKFSRASVFAGYTSCAVTHFSKAPGVSACKVNPSLHTQLALPRDHM